MQLFKKRALDRLLGEVHPAEEGLEQPTPFYRGRLQPASRLSA